MSRTSEVHGRVSLAFAASGDYLESCGVESRCQPTKCLRRAIPQRGTREANGPQRRWGGEINRKTLPCFELVQACKNHKLAHIQDDCAVRQVIGEIDGPGALIAQRDGDGIGGVVCCGSNTQGHRASACRWERGIRDGW